MSNPTRDHQLERFLRRTLSRRGRRTSSRSRWTSATKRAWSCLNASTKIKRPNKLHPFAPAHYRCRRFKNQPKRRRCPSLLAWSLHNTSSATPSFSSRINPSNWSSNSSRSKRSRAKINSSPSSAVSTVSWKTSSLQFRNWKKLSKRSCAPSIDSNDLNIL